MPSLLAVLPVQELPPEVAQVASPRVLDASDNHVDRLPPSLPPSLQRLVLANNRIDNSSLGVLPALQNLKASVCVCVGGC